MILGCLFFFMHCKGERIFFSIYSLFTLNKYILRIPSPLSSVRLSISRSFRSTYQDWWDGSAVWGPQHIFDVKIHGLVWLVRDGWGIFFFGGFRKDVGDLKSPPTRLEVSNPPTEKVCRSEVKCPNFRFHPRSTPPSID